MVLSHDHQRGHRKRGPTRDTRRAPLNPRFGVTPPVPFETRKPRDCESQDLQRDDAPTSAPPLVQVYLVAPVEQGTGGACRVPGYFFAQIQEATGPGVKRAEPPRLAGPRGSIAKRFRRRNNMTLINGTTRVSLACPPSVHQLAQAACRDDTRFWLARAVTRGLVALPSGDDPEITMSAGGCFKLEPWQPFSVPSSKSRSQPHGGLN